MLEKWFLLLTSFRMCQRSTSFVAHKYANAFITIQASLQSPIEHACCLRADCSLPALMSPPGARHPPTHLLSPSRLGFEGDDNTKVLHTGGWVWILWVTEQWPKQQRHVIQTLLASHPQLPSHFLWYQQTQRWKALGRNKMHLFSTVRLPPNPC